MKIDLSIHIQFNNCNDFFTAKEVCELLQPKVPALTPNRIGRFLAAYSQDSYMSRKGMKYLCRVNTM